MVDLEKIVKKFNLKNYIIYPLLIAGLTFGCGEKTDSINPTSQTPTIVNKKPKTTIIKPTNNQTFYSSSITAEWSGYDEDGNVAGFFSILSSGDNVLLSDYCNCNSKTFTTLNEATYSIKVIAKDNSGEYDPNPPEVMFNIKLNFPSSTGTTNSSGYAKLNIDNSTFDVYVKNEFNKSLNNIFVSGDHYDTDIYGFLAEDFSGDYLTNIYYTGGFGKSSKINEVSIFLRAKENNKIRERKFPSLNGNSRMEFIGTTTLTDMYDFYKAHDLLFQNVSLLEFLAETTGNKAFTFAFEAERFRENLIYNATNVANIINKISSYFDQDYDADAFYFDVYKHKFLGILTHTPNNNRSTLKGNIIDSGNQQPINNALIVVGTGISSDYTDLKGDYILKYLLPATYSVNASANNYRAQERIVDILAPNPPFYKSTYKDFQLDLFSTKDPYANLIVSYGDIDKYGNKNGSPNDILGAPNFPNEICGPHSIFDSGLCSLDSGWVIIDMGLGESIRDGSGNDLLIYSSSIEGGPQNYLEILASNSSTGPWKSLKKIYKTDPCNINDRYVNLTGSGLTLARYIKLFSHYTGDGNLHTNNWAGPEIDAIKALNLE